MRTVRLTQRLANMVDAVGTTIYGYTTAGLLSSEDGPWNDDTVSYTYNSERLLNGLSVLAPNASSWAQAYGYDGAERLTSLTSPAGTFGYGYDATRHAQVGSLTLPNSAFITNAFDSVARLLSTVLKNSTNGVLNSHQYGYNVVGQRTWLTNTVGDYRTYAYDNVSQLTNVFAHEANGAARVNEYLSYTYDPAGNLKTRYVLATTETFGVNSLNELTNEWRGGLNFDVAGTTTSAATNVLLTVNGGIPFSVTPYADNTWGVSVGLVDGTNTFVAVAKDALGRSDTNTVTCYLPVTNAFSYDLNGNLLGDGNRNFAYDDENELTSVWVTNVWRSDFVYDGKMRRRVRREYAWSSGSWLQTNEVHYVYDGNLVIQERDANNLPLVSYTRGRDLSGGLQGAGGIGGLLARSDLSTLNPQLSTAFYHADGNGNITCLINANQAIVAKYLYDPFGNILSKSGLLADINLYRSSSKEWQQNAALSYFGLRFYDPSLQRWPNRDPAGEAGGVNLYAYGNNDPINRVDPLGLLSDEMMVYRHDPLPSPIHPPPTDPVANAKNYVGAPNYSFYFPFPLNWVRGGNIKCNKFVGDCISDCPNRPKPLVRGRYPTANEWADPSVDIPGYSTPHSPPLPGDVVTDGNHVGFLNHEGNAYIEAPTYGVVKILPVNNPLWNPAIGRSPK